MSGRVRKCFSRLAHLIQIWWALRACFLELVVVVVSVPLTSVSILSQMCVPRFWCVLAKQEDVSKIKVEHKKKLLLLKHNHNLSAAQSRNSPAPTPQRPRVA